MLRVSIIFQIHNRVATVRQLLLPFLQAIRDFQPKFEMIIFDDGSTDGTKTELLDVIGNTPGVTYVHTDNIFETELTFRGMHMARGEYAILVQDDDFYETMQFITDAVRIMDGHPELSALSPKHGVFFNNRLDIVRVVGWYKNSSDLPVEEPPVFTPEQPFLPVDSIDRAPMIIRMADYKAIGGVDRNLFKGGWNDHDMCLRWRDLGKKVGLYKTTGYVFRRWDAGSLRPESTIQSEHLNNKRKVQAKYTTQMDLVTFCNGKFYQHALQLIESYKKFYTGTAYLYYFGDGFNPVGCDPTIVYKQVANDVPHAWEPGFFYAKVWALHDRMMNGAIGQNFIYLDSRHRFISRPTDIEESLQKFGHFFVQYPNLEPYKLKYLTTKICLQKVFGPLWKQGARDLYSYWAAIQAYTICRVNRDFINDFLACMKDPEIAGPSNLLQNPDGPGAECKAHRNDQSVLSMLLGRWGFSQPFDPIISSSYGDRETVEFLGGAELHNWNHVIRGRQ